MKSDKIRSTYVGVATADIMPAEQGPHSGERRSLLAGGYDTCSSGILSPAGAYGGASPLGLVSSLGAMGDVGLAGSSAALYTGRWLGSYAGSVSPLLGATTAGGGLAIGWSGNKSLTNCIRSISESSFQERDVSRSERGPRMDGPFCSPVGNSS